MLLVPLVYLHDGGSPLGKRNGENGSETVYLFSLNFIHLSRADDGKKKKIDGIHVKNRYFSVCFRLWIIVHGKKGMHFS